MLNGEYMSDINEQLDRQIGSIIHKLNSPLSAIRLWAMMIKEDHAALIDANKELAQGMKFIFDNAVKAIEILEDISESIRQSTSLDTISVEPLLFSALSKVDMPSNVIINHPFEEKNHNVLASNALIDVFINIITNALDAMPDGGELSISIEMSPSNDMVLINFTDTGLGMPRYMINSLFELYFTTKSKEKGRGIGLWWSREYARSVGGDLELFWTEIGKGASFLLSLQAAK